MGEKKERYVVGGTGEGDVAPVASLQHYGGQARRTRFHPSLALVGHARGVGCTGVTLGAHGCTWIADHKGVDLDQFLSSSGKGGNH